MTLVERLLSSSRQRHFYFSKANSVFFVPLCWQKLLDRYGHFDIAPFQVEAIFSDVVFQALVH
jgi:hypothetical protein